MQGGLAEGAESLSFLRQVWAAACILALGLRVPLCLPCSLVSLPHGLVSLLSLGLWTASVGCLGPGQTHPGVSIVTADSQL